MANASTMSPIRIEKSSAIEEYSNDEDDSFCENYETMLTSPDSSYRSSADIDADADADKTAGLEDDFRKENLCNLKFEHIIEKIEILRITPIEENENDVETTKTEKTENLHCSSDEENNTVEAQHTLIYDSDKSENSSPADDETSDELDDTEDSEEEDDEENEEVSDHGNLRERGPTGPSPFLPSDRELDQPFDYEGDHIPQPLIKKIHEMFQSQLNPCLDQLTIHQNQNLNDGYENQFHPYVGTNGCNDQSSPSPPAILVDDVDDSSTVKYLWLLQQGKCQPAQVISEPSNSVSSPPAKTWPDSPMSNYVMPSSSNSRSSSRTQSPGVGSLESPMMRVTSPLGSPQVVPSYRAPLEQSSPSSSNLSSHGDTSSPLSYYNSLNNFAEDQLSENLRTGFNNWGDSSATIVNMPDSVEFSDTLEKDDKTDEINWRNYQKSESSLICEPVSNFNDFLYNCNSSNSPIDNNQCQGQQCQVRQNSSLDCSLEFFGIDGNQILNYSPRQQGLTGCPYGGATLMENHGGNTYTKNIVPYSTYANTSFTDSMLQQDLLRNSLNFGNENLMNRTTDTLPQNLPVVQDRYVGGVTSNAGIIDSQRGHNYREISLTEQIFDNFQLPEPMKSSPKASRSRRNSLRKIIPWPSLNMPSTKASDRLLEGLTKEEIRDAMAYLFTKSPEELNKVDKDGDTTLMHLVSNPDELREKRVYLAPLVLRLRDTKGALTRQNTHDEDALYLAAMNCPEMPYVTGFLAAELWEKEIDISQTLYHRRGDTLIHAVAARGDTHGDVLAELLALKSSQGHPVFNLSTRNYDGKTALHLAILSHANGLKSVGIVRLLLENGADARLKENKGGDTALHMAVSSRDPTLVKVLLSKTGSDVTNVTNGTKNTALHIAAGLNDTCWDRQEKICRLLVEAGAQINIQNDCGKTPLALVSPERKEAIRRIFYRKS